MKINKLQRTLRGFWISISALPITSYLLMKVSYAFTTTGCYSDAINYCVSTNENAMGVFALSLASFGVGLYLIPVVITLVIVDVSIALAKRSR